MLAIVRSRSALWLLILFRMLLQRAKTTDSALQASTRLRPPECSSLCVWCGVFACVVVVCVGGIQQGACDRAVYTELLERVTYTANARASSRQLREQQADYSRRVMS